MIPANRLLDCVEHSCRFTQQRYLPFLCAGERIGWILPRLLKALKPFADTFVISDDAVTLHQRLADCATRSAAIADAVRQIKHLPGFGRWNDEYGALGPLWNAGPLLLLPRCAARPFGVRSHGSHVNGFSRMNGELCYWAAQRAAKDNDFGGYLDTLAGGYIAAEKSPLQVAQTETSEEAGIDRPSDLRPVSRVRGIGEDDDGVTPYTVYCFDLELAPGETPSNRDGEIDGFISMSVAGVVDAIEAGRFKFNAVPVIVDWMVRHGFVSPDEPGFLRLVDRLGEWDPDR